MKLEVAILCLTACTVSAFHGRNITAKDLTRRVGIEGGRLIDIEQRPYTVSLTSSDEYAGTGVLIHKEWVLTAAYNANSMIPKESYVRIASKSALKGGELVKISKFVIHPDYKTSSWRNDVALLKLSKPVKISRKIKPISLASTLPNPGAQTTVTGYGSTDYSLRYDGRLREAVIPFIPYITCKPHYHDYPEFTSQNFCAAKLKVGACPEDWGAPLVYKNKLIGIFSGSAGDCGSLRFPGIYADITQFKQWIQDTISH